MRGKSSYRKHNIHSRQTRQTPEQPKTKTRKQHECKRLQKHREHTETNKQLLRERLEYCLGTVSDKSHLGAFLYKFLLFSYKSSLFTKIKICKVQVIIKLTKKPVALRFR